MGTWGILTTLKNSGNSVVLHLVRRINPEGNILKDTYLKTSFIIVIENKHEQASRSTTERNAQMRNYIRMSKGDIILIT